MENNVAIRFEHVNKSYGNREILKDFNLEIRKGEFLTIIGNSGFGKTTVLKLINGLISPTFGAEYDFYEINDGYADLSPTITSNSRKT